MLPTKSVLMQGLVTATLLCVAQAASAGVANATCSSGVAKTAACQGGNKAGQPSGKDASCCEVKPANSANAATAKKQPPFSSSGPVTTAAATKPPPGSQTGPMDPTDGDKAASKVAPMSHGYYK